MRDIATELVGMVDERTANKAVLEVFCLGEEPVKSIDELRGLEKGEILIIKDEDNPNGFEMMAVHTIKPTIELITIESGKYYKGRYHPDEETQPVSYQEKYDFFRSSREVSSNKIHSVSKKQVEQGRVYRIPKAPERSQ